MGLIGSSPKAVLSEFCLYPSMNFPPFADIERCVSFFKAGSKTPRLVLCRHRILNQRSRNQHHYPRAVATTGRGVHDDLRRVEVVVPHLIGVFLQVVAAHKVILHIGGCHVHRRPSLAILRTIEDAFRAAVCKTCRFPTLTLPSAK